MPNQVKIKEHKTRYIGIRFTEYDYQQLCKEAYKRCLTPNQFIMYSLSTFIHNQDDLGDVPFYD